MLWATADRFFKISPNHIFGALEAYLEPKKFFTTIIILSTICMPQATADWFFRISLQIDNSLLQGATDRFSRISPNCKFGHRKAYSRGDKNTTIVTKWLNIFVIKRLINVLFGSARHHQEWWQSNWDPKCKAPNFVCFINLKYFRPYFDFIGFVDFKKIKNYKLRELLGYLVYK